MKLALILTLSAKKREYARYLDDKYTLTYFQKESLNIVKCETECKMLFWSTKVLCSLSKSVKPDSFLCPPVTTPIESIGINNCIETTNALRGNKAMHKTEKSSQIYSNMQSCFPKRS